MKTLQIEELDHIAFMPYGFALGAVGDGSRQDHFDKISNLRGAARVNLAQLHAPRYEPTERIIVDTIERHRFSSQSFFPLNVGQYLVLVGMPTEHGPPGVSQLKAFSVPGNVSITYKPGVWHMGISVLDGGNDFLMLIHEEGNAGDCDFASVESFEISR
ncbi:hypothetical protein D7I39_20165 [Allopusillimonas ginsengisoli]|nr:hypothetical protein D7I39_20165 [Allopusillimonas ginsengisoli]